MPENTIGIHLIMKDEADLLEQCLESVKEADEIIAVDTGSQDRSVSIARSFGAKVLHAGWYDDFSKPRNEALKHANTDWILYLDADECLMTDIETIRDLLHDSEAEAYTVLLDNVLGSRPEDRLANRSTRIFRNYRGYQFRGRIHEQIDTSIIRKHGLSSIIDSEITIRHFGYLPAQIDKKNKISRNTILLKKALEENPENPYYLYHMGISYCQSGDLAEAAAAMNQALALVSLHASYRPTIIRDLCKIKLELGEIQQTEALLRAELERYDDYPDLHVLRGQCLEASSLLDQAYEAYRNALNRSGSAYATEAGMGSYRPLARMAAIAHKRGLKQDAARLFNDALQFHNQYAPALQGIAELFYRLEVPDQEIASYLVKTVGPRSASEYFLILETLYHIGAYASVIDHCPPHLIMDPGCVETIASAYIQTGQLKETNRILNLYCSQAESENPNNRFRLWAITQWLLYDRLQEDFLMLIPHHIRSAYIRLDERLRGDSERIAANEDEELTQSLIRHAVALGQVGLASGLADLLSGWELEFAKLLYRAGYTRKAADKLLTFMKREPLDEESQFIIAELVWDKGHYVQAAEWFERIILENPEHEKARTGAALCYLHLAEESLRDAIPHATDAALFQEDVQRIGFSIRLLKDTGWHTEWTGGRRRVAYGAANDLALHDRQE